MSQDQDSLSPTDGAAAPSPETVAPPRPRYRRPQWLTLPTVESASNSMRAVVVNLVLLALLLISAPLIASQAARDQILLEPISVPGALQSTGLTPEVAAARLNDGLLQIIREAGSDKSSINAVPEGQKATFDIPNSGISVDALVSYARQFFNLHETVVGGEFRCGDPACTPALVSLRLRINGHEQHVVDLPPMRRDTEAEYFREAGLRVMSYLDPFTALAAEVPLHPSNAATIARQLIAAGHKDAKWAHNVLGNVRRTMGNPADAIAEYGKALEIDANFRPALANMASVLVEEKRDDEASGFLDRLARVDPDSALEADVRGDLARAAGKIDEARDWYLKAAARAPFDGRYKSKAAWMLVSENRSEEALAIAWSQFELTPADTMAIAFLSGYYGGKGDIVSLERLYRDAAEFSPENADYQSTHATLLMITKDYPAALARLDQALLIDEGSVKFRLQRADVLFLLGRYDDALVDLDLAGQRDPSNATVQYQRGRALQALGRTAESTAAYKQFVLMEPESPEATIARSFIEQAESPPAVPIAAPESSSSGLPRP